MRPARGFLVAASLGGLMGASGCTSLSPQDDPMFLRLNDIESRLVRIERVFDNESLIRIANQLDALREDTQQLRGEVEILRHETESASGRQRELYLDVDRRLQVLEQGRSGALAGVPGGAGPGGPFPVIEDDGAGAGALAGMSDQQAYETAFSMLQARRYDDAGRTFRQFLAVFPDSGLAHNAQYWLAETYYVQNDYGTALGEFERVLEEYPRSDKVVDALLKIGYCHYELRDWDAARAALRRVTREYPDTTAARLASQRLERIAQEVG